MFFASDNGGPAHPSVIEALADANTGYTGGYGADDTTARAAAAVREVFEAPDAAVHFVPTGTAANSLALASYTQPFQTVFCSDTAHIHEDECNAPEFYTGGAKLTLVPTTDGRMTPDALRDTIAGEGTRGVHGPQRGPVSITQITERGTIYSRGDLTALCEVAKDFGLPVHLDGARFANALVELDCTPAEMTWKAGVDVVSFGGTKNGLMGAEAVVFFDPEKAREFEFRRKRGGHLFSKHRYLSAQFLPYLDGGRWLDLARAANASRLRLQDGMRGLNDVGFAYEPSGNMMFPILRAGDHRRLFDAGAIYHIYDGQLDGAHDDDRLTARLVCDWSMTEDGVDRFLHVLRG
ncbi:low specificity L-threonine aldolase [Maritimibacter sp. UBA3975]|uniref:threonine aldolase family protein n=1 Tax=Maritimibacter sp. UBA3975 TaxID=1946833 RepID=UPI000C090A0B|nr:low specificity L-threonine aldolase [Maritimibacter sp. UBA3975]MAM63013.1 low specificity L-threonine aldolase [Maritimibacter sp.]|tara:strand:- start:55654 stop:56703 length:1050 start_codon:yes stop_codon:yes gene_type:complete